LKIFLTRTQARVVSRDRRIAHLHFVGEKPHVRSSSGMVSPCTMTEKPQRRRL
jgi:hypothetical protein